MPRKREFNEAFYLTQTVAGETRSVVFTVPDMSLLLKQSNSLTMFYSLDIFSWTLYFFSIILIGIVILLNYRQQIAKAFELTYLTLFVLVQNPHLSVTSKRIAHIIILFVSMTELLNIIIRCGIKTNLVTIDMSQFIDTIEQIENRKSFGIVTNTQSSFYAYISEVNNGSYPNIERKIFGPKKLLMKSMSGGLKIFASFLLNSELMKTTIFVVPDTYLNVVFQTLCDYLNDIPLKLYCSKSRLISIPTYIPYNFKILNRKPLVEYL